MICAAAELRAVRLQQIFSAYAARLPRQPSRANLSHILPEAARLGEETRREAVATTVWMVGISTAVLALLVTNTDKLPFLGPASLKTLVALLTVSIVGGAAQRVLHLISSAHEANARIGLMGFFAGFQSEFSTPEPRESDWTDIDVLAALKRDFGLDYDFLIGKASSAEIRDTYDRHYAMWEKFDRDHVNRVADAISEYSGADVIETRRRFDPKRIERTAQQLSSPKLHVTLFRAANVCMLASGVSLASAAALFAWRFIVGF